MNLFKKLILSILIVWTWFGFSIFAQEFSILPEKVNDAQVRDDVRSVWKVHDDHSTGYDSGKEYDIVWDRYKEISHDKDWKKRSLWDRLASGILSWDSLLEYVVYLVKFLSQIGLLIGWVMMIYAGYQYASSIFGWDASKGKTAIQRAIIGIVVITFSYAIMKVLTNMFIE